MKTHILSFLMLAFAFGASAQESITVEGRTLSGTELRPGIWIFMDGQDTIMAMDIEKFLVMEDTIAELRSRVKMNKEIMAAMENTISVHREFRSDAKQLINTQGLMIQKADSLADGYQQLYEDLKLYKTPGDFALIFGMGHYWSEDQGTLQQFNLGAQYKYVGLSYDYGTLYQGVRIHGRLPIFQMFSKWKRRRN